MSISAAGRTTERTMKTVTPEEKRTSRAAFYGLLVDYWEIMLPVVALGPAMAYFLPADLPIETKTTLAFLTFASAFIGRPLGSVIFGHFADTLGRKRTTVLCSAGLGFSVLLVALLPGYDVAGLWGLVGVLALRLTGGIFMGGQYTGANPLAMEASEKSRRGFVGGFIASAWPVAYIAVSLLTALLVAVMPSGSDTSAYTTWGWRIPFLLGAAMGFGLFLYVRKTAESEVWAASKSKVKRSRSPLSELFRGNNLRNLAQLFLLMTGIWFAIQMLTIAPTGLLISYLGLPTERVIWGLLLANVALYPCYLLFGVGGQRFGRRKMLIVAGVLTGVISVPAMAVMLHIINADGPFWLAMVCYTISLCISVAPNAIIIPYACERFKTEVRASGYGVGSTLAVIIPGLYSFILLGLAHFIRYEYGVVVLLGIGAACMVAGAALGPETKDTDL
ncbi:MFS transporter [Streptomyces sp. NE06-03E]|uniref:MFS transporter n=1 Tax=Streptomyces sp. NE06-03E TaxID=3028695 RepID=UPI0029CA7A15|nr:MFS transporter [Streptomyces sp. NE06-03E]